MTWSKLSDDFGDQCADLSDAAFRTHTEGLLWVMRRETGGAVTTRDVSRFAESADWREAVTELVTRGFWDQYDNGYMISHHMQHQPEVEVLAARRRNDAERQRRKRRKAAGLKDDIQPDADRTPDGIQPDSRKPLERVSTDSRDSREASGSSKPEASASNASRRDSDRDSRVDDPRDHPRDPGRVGSGRDGNPKSQHGQEEESRGETNPGEYEQCGGCELFSRSLLDGRCPKCRREAS